MTESWTTTWRDDYPHLAQLEASLPSDDPLKAELTAALTLLDSTLDAAWVEGFRHGRYHQYAPSVEATP